MLFRRNPKTAAEWMAKLRSPEGPEHQEAYEQWLDARPENRAEAAQLDHAWQAMDALEDDPLVQEILGQEAVGQEGVAEEPRRWWMPGPAIGTMGAMGAVLSLVLVLASVFTWRFLIDGDVYETATGEQRVVALADGSRLHLNVATRLEVKLQDGVRDVRLAQGQAFFDIASDPERPFVVTAGDKEITVLGTKFDVLVQGGETRVTVVEGRVAVTALAPVAIDGAPTPSPAPLPQVRSSSEPRLELTDRDAVSWPREAPPSPLESTAALEAVDAWRSGKVIFDNTPLDEAIVELDRYTPVGVRLGSPELGATTVSGVFYVDRLAEVDPLIFALESSLPVTVERRGDELLLKPSDRSSDLSPSSSE